MSFESTDNRRTENNTMRSQYRTLNELEKQYMGDFKTIGEDFLALLDDARVDQLGDNEAPRHFALAKTKMEEAVMWAVKGVTG